MRRGRDWRLNGRFVLAVLLGLGVALAVLEYGSATGSTSGVAPHIAATAAAFESAAPRAGETRAKAKKLTKAQKLAKALKACRRKKPKSKRKACEVKAKKLYGKREAPNKVPREETKPTESLEQEKTHAKTVSTTPTSASVTAGKTIFTDNCASCHGPLGNGTAAGPNLHVMPRAQSVTGVIEQLIEPEGGMPDFDKVLSFAQKEQAADYVTVEITKVATAAQPGF